MICCWTSSFNIDWKDQYKQFSEIDRNLSLYACFKNLYFAVKNAQMSNWLLNLDTSPSIQKFQAPFFYFSESVCNTYVNIKRKNKADRFLFINWINKITEKNYFVRMGAKFLLRRRELEGEKGLLQNSISELADKIDTKIEKLFWLRSVQIIFILV